MKKMKSLFAVLFAVTCIGSMSCVAFAQTLTPAVEMPPVVSESSDVSSSSDAAEEAAMEPLPQVVEIDPEEYAAAVGQSDTGEEQESAEALTEQADPAEGSSNNTMYFVGAGAAVLLLAGVIAFCKVKGKQ